MKYSDLKVKTRKVYVCLVESDYLKAKRTCEKFYGKRYFSQFVREAIRRYVEYFKMYEDAGNTIRFYCDLDPKVYKSLMGFCEDKDVQPGEIASLLLSEKLYEMGVCDDNYFIPDM